MSSPDTAFTGPRVSSRHGKAALMLACLTLAGALQGCATQQNRDPLEPWNRKVFAFNETVDAKVLKPVAEGYKKVTPEPVRTAFTNFVNNLRDVWSTANLFLQGRFTDGTLGVIRVSVNSTLGLGGLIDIATPMQLDRPNEDFGQTLGVWGVGPGAYIVWPILGPSTLRDSVSLPGDMYFSASSVGTYPREKNLLLAWQAVNTRANLLDAGNLLDDVALDKYSFMRDGYLQRRESLIHDGKSYDEDEPDSSERYDLPEKDAPPQAVPAPAPAPASSPASSVSSGMAPSLPETPQHVAIASTPVHPMATSLFHARTPVFCDAAEAGTGLSTGTSIAALWVQTRFLKGSPCLPPTNSL